MSLVPSKIRTGFRLVRSGDWSTIKTRLGKRFVGSTFVPDLPTSLLIEGTNACNLRCPACPTGAGTLKRPKRMMKFEEFKKIIDEVKGHVTHLTPYNYGEPFLQKDFLRMVEYATSAGMHQRISTNGQFIRTKEFAQEVVRSGLQHLIIALDGVDQETVGKYRRGTDFNKVIEATKLLVEAKKELKSSTPIIELQFIVMKHNEHQLEAARELSIHLGVDSFKEKTVGLNPNEPNFQDLAEEFLPTDTLRSRYELKEDGTYDLKGEIPNYCSWVFNTTVINSDGSVVPCCYDPNGEYTMGNVFEEDLKDIWKNEKYQKFREQILRDRASIPICRTCSEGRYKILKTEKLA